MAHGWAAVKEMNLDYFAAACSDVGVAALVFDHRGFGASDGPRGEIDPEQQIADYQSVLALARRLEDVDSRRLGVWGTSFSGGHVLRIAERERSLRAVVAQVPTISGAESMRRRLSDEKWAALVAEFERERERIAHGLPPRFVPAADVGGRPIGPSAPSRSPVAPTELPPAPTRVYRDEERWEFYAELPPERMRTWSNQITLSSLERYASYAPGSSLARVSPTPLLVIYAAEDTITPSDLTREAINGAGPFVEAHVVPGGHYGVYTTYRTWAATTAAGFLAKHL